MDQFSDQNVDAAFLKAQHQNVYLQDCHCEGGGSRRGSLLLSRSNAGDCRAAPAMTESQENFLVKLLFYC